MGIESSGRDAGGKPAERIPLGIIVFAAIAAAIVIGAPVLYFALYLRVY